MGAPALSRDLIEQWSDRRWRLNNLYFIQDKRGNIVRFELNSAQSKLLENIHYLNIILKARQMGFSTFILILALDCCIMNRKPEPVALVDCGAANRNGEIDPTHFADAWRYANSRNQCQQLQGVVDRAYTRQINALRASLDETETVFIGWDTNGGPA